MKKIFMFLAVLPFFACGGDDNDPDIPKEPEIPAKEIKADIVVQDTIFNNKSIELNLKTENKFDKVEYYLDGELIGTSINDNYKINWTPKGLSGGKHNIQVVCQLESKTHKFDASCYLKLLIGEEYAGGIIIDLNIDGLGGLVAAKNDIKNPEDDDYRFRWTKTSIEIGAKSKDGKVNTEQIIDSFSTEDFTFAKFLKNGINIEGFDDWYVPSLEESEMINKDIVPNLHLDKYYWTSTETDSERAVFFHFKGTLMGTNQTKNYLYYIRLVRKF